MRLAFSSLCIFACATALPCQNVGITLTSGVNGYLEVPFDPAMIPPSGLTVEAWVTYDSTTLQPGFVWPTILRQNILPGRPKVRSINGYDLESVSIAAPALQLID